MSNTEKAKTAVASRLQALRAINIDLATQIPVWTERTLRALQNYIHADELISLASINTYSWDKDKDALDRLLEEFIRGIDESPELFLSEQAAPVSVQPPSANNVAFIVHGHDVLAKVELARTLEQVGITPIVLHEQPNYGRTIIEKFEGNAAQASFAIILLTPDDTGHPAGKTDEAKPRARQNVILELGYFLGALGRKRVLVLYKGNVEIPSDYLGVIYIAMDESGAWKFTLAKEMRASGASVDLNRLA